MELLQTPSRFCNSTTTLGYDDPSADLMTVSHAPGLLARGICSWDKYVFPPKAQTFIPYRLQMPAHVLLAPRVTMTQCFIHGLTIL